MTLTSQFVRSVAAGSRLVSGLQGRGRVGMLLGHRFAGRLERDFDIRMRMGHRMVAPTSSSQSWRAAFTGEYDDEVIRFLTAYVNPGALVLDIGASLGFYTVPLATAARSLGARVLAIEPVPANCSFLRRNIVRNGLDDVVDVINVALGSSATTVDLHVEGSGAGNAAIADGVEQGEMRRHDDAGQLGTRTTINVSRLDDLEIPGPRCSLMKMDVEGYELNVLAGAKDFVIANRPVIFGEFSPEWLRSRGFAEDSPLQWALTHRYSAVHVYLRRAGHFTDRRQVVLKSAHRPDPGAEGLLLIPEG